MEHVQPTAQAQAPTATPQDTQKQRKRLPATQYANLIAIALLCCAAAYRIVLIARGWPVFDSDQAIIGLMARHIWLNGEHPLFFYGQYYMGPGEAYAAVPFFAVMGSSILALRLAMLPFMLLFLVEVYVLGRVAYGPVTAVLALAWLAVGPSIAVYRGIITEGGMQEALVLGGLILLGVWVRLRLPERRPRTGRAWLICLVVYALLGVACGLAVWSDWLIVPLVALSLLVLLLARPREILSWAGGALALGFVLGAWPFIQFNLTHQFASLNQAVYFSGNSTGTLGSHLAGLLTQFGNAATITLPAIFGSPHVCVQQASEAGLYDWFAQVGIPGDSCALENQLFALLILAIFALAAWPLWRVLAARWRGLEQRLESLQAAPTRARLSAGTLLALWRKLDAPISAAAARLSARLWLRGILLVNAVVLVLAYVNNALAQSYPLDTTRYLVPLYLSAPLIFGTLWETFSPLPLTLARLFMPREGRTPGARPAGGSVARMPPTPRNPLVVLGAGITLVLLLAFSLSSGRAMLSESADAAAFGLPVDPPWVAHILTIFEAHHVQTFYTDDYYMCYRVAFETNERQACAVLAPDGQVASEASGANRYEPYLAAIANDPHPAYLLTASPSEQAAFEHGPLPEQGYIRLTDSGVFAIYVYGGPPPN